MVETGDGPAGAFDSIWAPPSGGGHEPTVPLPELRVAGGILAVAPHPSVGPLPTDPPTDERAWFQKRRYMIPTGMLVAFGVAAAVVPWRMSLQTTELSVDAGADVLPRLVAADNGHRDSAAGAAESEAEADVIEGPTPIPDAEQQPAVRAAGPGAATGAGAEPAALSGTDAAPPGEATTTAWGPVRPSDPGAGANPAAGVSVEAFGFGPTARTDDPAADPPTAQPTVTDPVTTDPATTALCHPEYGGCVPVAVDVDCVDSGEDGPVFIAGPIEVVGIDAYNLDPDGNRIACD